jgi:hypothetical protein
VTSKNSAAAKGLRRSLASDFLDTSSLSTKLPTLTMSTVRKSLDILYYTFVLTLLLGIVALDVLHWPVWNKDWHFSFSTSLEQFYIKTYNDPLSANLPIPNGWQNGMYFCEQLHLPFLLYYLFGKGLSPTRRPD